MGFNQERAIELGLDLSDLALLGWIKGFSMRGNMKSIRKNGKTLYWVSYSTMLEDLPILGFDKRWLAQRMKVLEDKKVLVKYVDKKAGNMTYFGFGEKAKDLEYPMQEKHHTLCKKNDIGMQEKPHTLCKKKSIHIPNTNNLDTIPIIEEKEEEKDIDLSLDETSRDTMTIQQLRALYEN